MRYELADREWVAIKPMLPNKPRGTHGLLPPSSLLRRTSASLATNKRYIRAIIRDSLSTPAVCIWCAARGLVAASGRFPPAQEIADDSIVFVRLFDVDRMSGVRNHRECGRRGDALFHEDAGQQTWPVFIAGDDQRGHREVLHLLDQIVERGALLSAHPTCPRGSRSPRLPV